MAPNYSGPPGVGGFMDVAAAAQYVPNLAALEEAHDELERTKVAGK